MTDWLKHWPLAVVAIAIVLFMVVISFSSSPLPTTVQDDRFRCNVWGDATIQLQSGGFNVSSGGAIYNYPFFDPLTRRFSHFSANCEKGCIYYGRLENMQYYGRLSDDSPKKYPVALIDSNNILYGCSPEGLA